MADMPLVPGSPEAIALYREGKLKKERNHKVCVCGHSVSYHTQVSNRSVCSPGKIRSCKCSTVREVAEAQNLRLFMCVTEGSGGDHALGKGFTASDANGKEYTWIGTAGVKCDMCLADMQDWANRHILAIDPFSGMPADRSTGIDKIVCTSCYLDIQTGTETQ
jgi:hypothetical protein